jgi:hypothetical protein
MNCTTFAAALAEQGTPAKEFPYQDKFARCTEAGVIHAWHLPPDIYNPVLQRRIVPGRSIGENVRSH